MNRHGGNLRELAGRAGRSPTEMLDFSASINPLGPPESLRMTISRHLEEIVHYPDPDSTELVAALSARYDVPAEQIIVGNGSTELLFAAAAALDYRRAVIPSPSYSDYARSVRQAGREVEEFALLERKGFRLDWERLESRFPTDEPGMVILGQPNNPTGLLLDVNRLRAAAASHPRTWFVIDEAFAGFVPGYRSMMEEVPGNVVVLCSLTKLYAIAGLRLGFAVARSDVADRIRARVLPWSVNSLGQHVGAAFLRQEDDYVHRSRAFVVEQRERLMESLKSVPGLHVYPGAANYLLVRIDGAPVDDLDGVQVDGVPLLAGMPEKHNTPPEPRTSAGPTPACRQAVERADNAGAASAKPRRILDAFALSDCLLRDGIAIRTFGPGQHLDGRFFRVAVRTAEENESLCRSVAAAFRSDSGTASPAYLAKRKTPAIMFQGTSSNAGKSLLTAALCRILFQDGFRVAPFKSQNMSLNSFVTRDGGEMGRAQVVQAQASRLEPDVRMNPILLKPNSDTGCQVIVRGKPVGNMRVGQYVRYKPEAFAAACECYDGLAAEFDAVVLEGAGSPGEVNLKSHDIVNMRMAQYAGAPVLVVGDIDRGGVFASFVGTMEVLADWERKLVAGWIVNRFRGDASLLDSALEITFHHTGRSVLGVVPYLHGLNIPQEDSVEFKAGPCQEGPNGNGAIEIAVIDLPHLSNFTDFDAFRVEPDVRLRIVRSPADLQHPDAILIGGSKNTLGDLEYLNTTGVADRIVRLAREGQSEIVGICGGLQMLGEAILDPLGIESGNSCVESCVESCATACLLPDEPLHEAESDARQQASSGTRGLGLLNLKTVMAAEKTLVRATARHALSGLEVSGYEIHHGQTDIGSCVPLFCREDGQIVGAASADGRVWGTYLHGVFDADPFRRWFIDRLRARRGLPPLGQVVRSYDIEPALDRLAEVVRLALPVERIYRLMGLR